MNRNKDKPENTAKNADPRAAIEMTDDEKIDLAAAQILEIYREAFEELAK